MKKLVFPILLLLLSFAPTAFAQNVTVTGNLQNMVGVAKTTNTFVRMRLRNYSGFVPKVDGTAIILPDCGLPNAVCEDFFPNASGVVSGTLYGNDIIDPVGTYYTGEFWVNGKIAFSCDYKLQAPTFNFNTAACLSQAIPIGPNQLITQSYLCLQPTPAVTWTCADTFGDPNTLVEVFDPNGKILWPDSIVSLDANTVQINFIAAQAGRAVLMHAGSVSIATNQPNAVLQNPTGAQVIDSGQTLTISGPLIVTSTASFSGGGSIGGTFAGTPILTALWTFNGGISSAGPNTLSGGGTTTGAWTHSGTHAFNAAPSFTASPGFSITSNTLIPNLNASLLLGNTWAAPGNIGGTTAAQGVFTILTASSSLSINGGSALTTSNQSGTGNLCLTINCALTSPAITTPVINTSVSGTALQGTDTKLLTAGTVSGAAGSQLCIDANNGATTTGCPASGINQWFSVTGCTTAQSTDSSCSGTITLPQAYADSTYIPVMTPNSVNGAFISVSVSGSLSAGSFPYTLTCTFNCSVIVAPTIYVFTHHN